MRKVFDQYYHPSLAFNHLIQEGNTQIPHILIMSSIGKIKLKNPIEDVRIDLKIYDTSIAPASAFLFYSVESEKLFDFRSLFQSNSYYLSYEDTRDINQNVMKALTLNPLDTSFIESIKIVSKDF